MNLGSFVVILALPCRYRPFTLSLVSSFPYVTLLPSPEGLGSRRDPIVARDKGTSVERKPREPGTAVNGELASSLFPFALHLVTRPRRRPSADDRRKGGTVMRRGHGQRLVSLSVLPSAPRLAGAFLVSAVVPFASRSLPLRVRSLRDVRSTGEKECEAGKANGTGEELPTEGGYGIG